jgi:uncharacterized protein (TIGR01777 family)
VLVSGSSGLVGNAVVDAMTAAGHGVTRLVRRPAARAGEASWDPAAGRIEADRLEGHDAAVHLAGENVAARRWTERQKARIRDSRVRATELLCTALSRLSAPPRVVVGASAIGYYGSRGDAVLTESSAPGADFLARVCIGWESAYGPLAERGTRLVVLRIGVVLSGRGGALARMLPLFRLGLGGKLGSGRQYFSWIALEDLVAVVQRALDDDGLAGPCNATAPRPVTNAELTRALGRALRRPTALAVPALALRCLLGEMADGLLLSSTRVMPERLQRAGFEFRFPELEAALRHALAPAGRQDSSQSLCF